MAAEESIGVDREGRPSQGPGWWRGLSAETYPAPRPHESVAVLSGVVTAADLANAPRDRMGFQQAYLDQAACTGLDVDLDDRRLTVLWSQFDGCTFRQTSRPPRRGGATAQGSLGTRPSVYRGCTFRQVRFAALGGFSPLSARFEDCWFDRCRFSGSHFFTADLVGCRFAGKVETAVIGATPEHSSGPSASLPVEIVGNDFSEAIIRNLRWLSVDPAAQTWPAGYTPTS